MYEEVYFILNFVLSILDCWLSNIKLIIKLWTNKPVEGIQWIVSNKSEGGWALWMGTKRTRFLHPKCPGTMWQFWRPTNLHSPKRIAICLGTESETSTELMGVLKGLLGKSVYPSLDKIHQHIKWSHMVKTKLFQTSKNRERKKIVSFLKVMCMILLLKKKLNHKLVGIRIDHFCRNFLQESPLFMLR